MKIKAVLLDLDGTLMNTMPDLKFAMNSMLKEKGFKKLNEEEIKNNIGYGVKVFVNRSLPEDKKNDEALNEECYKRYQEIYSTMKQKAKLFKGIKQLLLDLDEKGYYIAILSNKPLESVQEIEKQFFSDFNITFSIGESDNFPAKPNPQSAFFIANKLRIQSDEMVMIGDGIADYDVAVNANMKHIAALWGYTSKEKLAEKGATAFAKKPKDVIDLIEEMNK